MRHVLTVRQPWASLIIHGGKDVENRTWIAPSRLIGKRLWIHAGKRIEEVPAVHDADISCCDWRDQAGRVLGSVLLSEVVRVSEVRDCKWATGPWCWVLTDPKPCRPFSARGKQGIWRL